MMAFIHEGVCENINALKTSIMKRIKNMKKHPEMVWV